jgi:hypothetical protein
VQWGVPNIPWEFLVVVIGTHFFRPKWNFSAKIKIADAESPPFVVNTDFNITYYVFEKQLQ